MVKLFCGLIFGDEGLARRAVQLLGKRFGTIDMASDVWPFDATDYYEPEMGPNLKRQFVAFERLIDPGRLVEIKQETNALEAKLCDDAGTPPEFRLVNLDPGYIELSKLVLATTKNYSHRLYLGGGIFGEVTLHWHDDAWRAWPWTYPDYASDRYHAFFTQVREQLRDQLAASTAPDDRQERPGP